MTVNESPLDRILRTVLAVAALVVAFATGAGSALGIVLIALSAILLVTAAIGYCPLYRVLGLSTVRAAARTGDRS
ncbi:MAG: DUF2892 domain-containing protein [Frankiales bacterium]|nr:DUF2892 domain-containing protein [Frankiales bacterium]